MSTRIALLFWRAEGNTTLSYQHGWPRAFQESPWFDFTPFNLASYNWKDKLSALNSIRTGPYDAIVLMHSCFSNQQNIRRLPLWLLGRCPQPKVFFIGNEYKLMPEKVRFAKQAGISLLISQSNDPRVLKLYKDAIGCDVGSIPNTGFDPEVFFPVTDLKDRDIDVGYRSYEAPWYLGNLEKNEIADFFTSAAPRYGLTVNISMSHEDRFDASGYAAFLNRCRGQVGTESCTDFFELTDSIRKKVNAYMNTHPDVSWPEIKSKFFDDYGPSVPLRIISGRQVEAAACKSVQILFEGRYSDYLQPDVHYIPLAKDFSNIDEVIEKLNDDSHCIKLVDAAYDMAMQELTYDHLIKQLADLMAPHVQ